MKRFHLASVCLTTILLAGPAWADIHVIRDPNDPTPTGRVEGVLYDATAWLGSAASYGTSHQYMGDTPVSGSLSYDTPYDDYEGELSAFSEAGLWYAKAYAESSNGSSTGATAEGVVTFTADHPQCSLHYQAVGLGGYDDYSWSISLFRYTNIVDNPVETILTWSSSTDPPDATQSLGLDTSSTYILGWRLSVGSDNNPIQHNVAELNISLTDTPDTDGHFSILWISEHHESTGNLSIDNTQAPGYSQVAAIAEQVGAVNVEVDDSTEITESLLAPYALIIIGVSEQGPIRSQAEVDVLISFVADGGILLVMAGGTMNAGAYANSISAPFGVTFDLDPVIETGTAGLFFTDPITEGVSALSFVGPNYLHVAGPAVLLGMAGDRGILARRHYGSGTAYFWGDDWVFMNDMLGKADNRRFAENLFALTPRPTDPGQSQEQLLIWPLWEGRTWTYHCRDSNGTTWTQTRQVIDSNTFDAKKFYKVRIADDCPYAPTETELHVRSTRCALYQWRDGKEVLIITAGPVGAGILDDNTVRQIVSQDTITVPYGGPYSSYTYGIRGIGDPDPYAAASFVQGLGFVRLIDYVGDYAPVTRQLQYIAPDHLCGDYGYPHPVADLNQDCIVNWADCKILFEHWLDSPF